MLSNYRIFMDSVLLGLLTYHFLCGGYWSTYYPRPGIECTAFHKDYKSDVDCYKIKENKNDE